MIFYYVIFMLLIVINNTFINYNVLHFENKIMEFLVLLIGFLYF